MGQKTCYRYLFANSSGEEKSAIPNQQRLLDWWRCVHPFWVQLCYFVFLSSVGFLLLRVIPFSSSSGATVEPIDLLFMSVSSVTVSSMATLEMEIFSKSQLLVMTALMLLGGEVFTSMLSLHLNHHSTGSGEKMSSSSCKMPDAEQELEVITLSSPVRSTKPRTSTSATILTHNSCAKGKSRLGYVVLGYLVVIHVVGSCSVLLYLTMVPSAGKVLRRKGINPSVFSVFTVASTFSNCGFLPLNESMLAFRNHSGLLLILATLVLAGNTLFPPLLRLVLWVIQWVEMKRLNKNRTNINTTSSATDQASSYWSTYQLIQLLEDGDSAKYPHLLPRADCLWLVATAAGFVLSQTLLLCSLEWEAGLSIVNGGYRKLVAALFQSVNSRHAGESILDLSAISPAILVLYVVMMFLPPYTRFMPIQSPNATTTSTLQNSATSDVTSTVNHAFDHTSKLRVSIIMSRILEGLLLSQLSYLVFFTIIICITERKHLSTDPLNFSVLNIVVEVTSAYGNVGFSTCYHCQRQLMPDPNCQDAWYGFVGRWSTQGKLVLMATMFFGRLKSFSVQGGRMWRLL